MRWILLDLLLALLALGLLAVLLLGLWRKVKRLSATVSAASETVGRATEALTAAQLDGPLGGTPARPGAARPGATGRSPGVQR